MIRPDATTLLRSLLVLQLRRLRNRIGTSRTIHQDTRSKALSATIANVGTAIVLGAAVLLARRSPPRGLEPVADLVAVGSYQLVLLISSILLATIATARLSDDKELIWFSTLPLPMVTLFPYRVLSAVASRLVWAVPLWAFLHGIGVTSRSTAFRAALALPMAALLHGLICTAATSAEFLLRGFLGRRHTGHIQITCLVLSAVVSLPVLAPAVIDQAWLRPLVVWATFESPASLAVRLLREVSIARQGMLFTALLLECFGLLLVLGLLTSHFMQRRTVAISEGARMTGGRQNQNRLWPWLRLLGPFERRNMTLLARDSRYLLQSMMPVLLVVGCSVAVMIGGAGNLSASPHTALLVGLGTVSMVSLWGGAPFLGNESRAFWMLFTLPVNLHGFLLRKAFQLGRRGWVLAVTAILLMGAGDPTALLVSFLWVTLAAAILAPLSISISVLSFDSGTERQNQSRLVAYVWLYLGVAALFTGTVLLAPTSATTSIAAVLALVTLAFWQRASRRFPLLLDTEGPSDRPRVLGLGHALLTVLVFFTVQRVVNTIIDTQDLLSPALAVSALVAVTYTQARLRMGRLRHRFPLVGADPYQSVGLGLTLGVACLVSTMLIRELARIWWPAATGVWLGDTGHDSPSLDLILFATIAAPAEEYIFRGILFPTLRSSMSRTRAILLSSAIFAAVHPPASIGPAFLVGVTCAWLVARRRGLFAAAIAHLVYNLGLLILRT